MARGKSTPVGRGFLKASRTRYGVIAFAMTLVVITYIDRVAMAQAAPLIRKDFDLSTTQMGWVFSAFGIAYTLFEIPGGWMADRLGPRKVLTRIVIWWSFFTAATGWTWNLPSLLATRFLFGVGEAGCFPTINQSFSVWLTRKERVLAHGLKAAAYQWGGAVTPLLVVLMLERMSWRQVFGIFGAVGALWAVPFYFWYRDNPARHAGVNAAELALLPGATTGVAQHDIPWAAFFGSIDAWLLWVQWFCFDYCFYFNLTWLPTYLLEVLKFDLRRSALLAGLPLLSSGAGNLCSAFLMPHLTRWMADLALARRTMALSAFSLSAGALLVLSVTSKPQLAVPLMCMAAFTAALSEPVSWTACIDLGGKSVGTLSAAMNTMGQLGGTVSPLVVGMVLDRTGHQWNIAFYISAGILAIGALCWVRLDPVTALEVSPHE